MWANIKSAPLIVAMCCYFAGQPADLTSEIQGLLSVWSNCPASAASSPLGCTRQCARSPTRFTMAWLKKRFGKGSSSAPAPTPSAPVTNAAAPALGLALPPIPPEEELNKQFAQFMVCILRACGWYLRACACVLTSVSMATRTKVRCQTPSARQ